LRISARASRVGAAIEVVLWFRVLWLVKGLSEGNCGVGDGGVSFGLVLEFFLPPIVV
jgi:hypothetical protein